jgi:hypothetical protein
MLLVKTVVTTSTIHGKGIFAAQDIPKGTLIWEYDSVNDLTLTEHQHQCLANTIGDAYKNAFVLMYFDKDIDQYVLHTDGLQYMNNSFDRYIKLTYS